MSVIYITDHNELIFDALKTRKKIIKKPPRYKNYLDTTIDLGSKDKKKYATMGPAEMPPPDPANFLRKTTKEPIKKSVRKQPKQTEKPQTEQQPRPKSEKKQTNFIRKNIEDIHNKKPPVPIPKYVDTRTGISHRLEPSGLVSIHIHSETYGKAPKYVLKRIDHTKTIQQSKKDLEHLETSDTCYYITRQERQELLNGLKQNWEEMQKGYQLLPMITDTIPRIVRKTKLENELKQLEKDIALIEKHPYIYVIKDHEE